MNSNPYKASTPGPLLAKTRGLSWKHYAVASTIAVALFAIASLVCWYALGATYADGQVTFGDPTVRFETDINGGRFSAYDRFYMIDDTGFIVLHIILLVVLLLVVNLLVWIVILLRTFPQTG